MSMKKPEPISRFGF